MKYVPLILFLLVIVGLLVFSARAKRRQAEGEAQRRESIAVGSEVMTTSGLYGTVVALHDDDTVTLSIAPGIEVKWAFAALRDISSLPEQYARGARDGAAAGGLGDTDPAGSAGPLFRKPTGADREPPGGLAG